jgi:predicted histone-like DNA-binding protein
MKYKAIQRVNPLDRTKSKWYASPVNEGKIAKADLAKEIVDISSLSRGDVSNAIETLIDVVPKYLLMGKSVNLGELGTLRVSFSSEGAETAAAVSANKISGVKIVFIPSVELKKRLANIRFEKVTTAPTPADDKPQED